VWGIVIQAAFQPHMPISDPAFANAIFLLALAIYAVLSVWIRYTTIHRCIVIRKLDRSHEIEQELERRSSNRGRLVLAIGVNDDV
jgi:hypothetical protein